MLQGSSFPSCGLTQGEKKRITQLSSCPCILLEMSPMDSVHRTQPVCQQEPAPLPFSSLQWIISSSYQAAVAKWKNLPLCLSTTSNIRFNDISSVIYALRLAPEIIVQVQNSCRQHPFALLSSGAGGAQPVEAGSFFSSCTVLWASRCPCFYFYKARHECVNQPTSASLDKLPAEVWTSPINLNEVLTSKLSCSHL